MLVGLLAIVGGLGLVFGCMILQRVMSGQATALHEIEMLIAFLIGTTGIGFASAIEALTTRARSGGS